MKKSTKQERLSRVLVFSSFFVLTGPFVTQALVSLPVSAETIVAPARTEASLDTSEELPEQQENAGKTQTTGDENVVTEASSTTESQVTENTETTNSEDSAEAANEETTASSEKEKVEKASTKAAGVLNAISADISLLKGNTTEAQPASQTLAGNNYAFLGAKGTFTVETSNLVAGNSIIIAEVTQSTTELSGAKANFDSHGTGVTLLDNKGNPVGKIQYDNSLKAITLKVTDTVTAEGDIQSYSFMGPYMMGINVHSPNDVIAKMPFSNTISVSGKDYTFDFTKIDSDAATKINSDSLGFDNTPTNLSFNNFLFHKDIADESVLNELQSSNGAAGAVLGNTGIKYSFKISTESDFLFTGAHLVLGNYYVSAATNKIQTLEGDTRATANWNKVAKKISLVNLGDNATLDELSASANSTGIYYSLQADGNYLVVEYISPEDTILTDEEIIANTRAHPLAGTSSDVEADIQATLDYYHGVLGNRASCVIPALRLKWADEYSSNTLTANQLDENGEITRTVSATSTPNTIASGNTSVKVHYADLNGRALDSIVTKAGPPTGKANELGDFSNAEATVDPKTITGYQLVTDISKLTTEQRHQLEATLSGLGLYAATANVKQDKTVFATSQLNVPYPGFADTSYDASGNIVTDGSGTKGYGETDVYYFYVGTPQKVVYNVIDDTDEKSLESDVEFDVGTSNANLAKKQEDLQAIADEYLSKGYEIVSVDPVPGVFDTDDSKDQVVTIHLKHAMEVKEETKTVKRTIHYVYEDGTEAAPDQTDTVTHIQTKTEDRVTGEVAYTDWAAKDNDTTFDEVKSPEIDNYTPDKEAISEVTGLTEDSKDIEETVTYTAKKETTIETREVKQTIHYVYEDGIEAAPDKLDSVTFTRTVTTNEATGKVTHGEWVAKDDDTTFDEVKSPEIDNYTADKELIGKVTDLTGESKDNEVTVTYMPKIEERVETKEINRVIHYVYEDGTEAAPDKTDTVTFTSIVMKNLATGEITTGDWVATNDDTTFDEVKSPEIDGYVVDKKVVEEVKDVEADDKDLEETVTYKKLASAPSNEEPSDSTTPSSEETTPTTDSTTASSESKDKTTTAVPKSSGGGTTNQATITTKTSTSSKTLPSTGEKVRHYLTWFGGFAVAAAAILGVLVNRSKRKVK